MLDLEKKLEKTEEFFFLKVLNFIMYLHGYNPNEAIMVRKNNKKVYIKSLF